MKRSHRYYLSFSSDTQQSLSFFLTYYSVECLTYYSVEFYCFLQQQKIMGNLKIFQSFGFRQVVCKIKSVQTTIQTILYTYMALPNQSFIFSSVLLIDEEKPLVEKQATDSNENLLPDRPASRRKMMRRRSSTSGALLVQKDADQKGLVSTHKTLCVSRLLPLSGFYF